MKVGDKRRDEAERNIASATPFENEAVSLVCSLTVSFDPLDATATLLLKWKM